MEVSTPTDLPSRIAVIKRRDVYERDPEAFGASWAEAEAATQTKLLLARGALHAVRVEDAMLELAARLCIAAGTDGLRGELTLIRAARALAALEGADAVGSDHLRRLAPMGLRHRLRRNPLDDAVSSTRVARAVDEVFAA